MRGLNSSENGIPNEDETLARAPPHKNKSLLSALLRARLPLPLQGRRDAKTIFSRLSERCRAVAAEVSKFIPAEVSGCIPAEAEVSKVILAEVSGVIPAEVSGANVIPAEVSNVIPAEVSTCPTCSKRPKLFQFFFISAKIGEYGLFLVPCWGPLGVALVVFWGCFGRNRNRNGPTWNRRSPAGQ